MYEKAWKPMLNCSWDFNSVDRHRLVFYMDISLKIPTELWELQRLARVTEELSQSSALLHCTRFWAYKPNWYKLCTSGPINSELPNPELKLCTQKGQGLDPKLRYCRDTEWKYCQKLHRTSLINQLILLKNLNGENSQSIWQNWQSLSLRLVIPDLDNWFATW